MAIECGTAERARECGLTLMVLLLLPRYFIHADIASIVQRDSKEIQLPLRIQPLSGGERPAYLRGPDSKHAWPSQTSH